MTSLFDLAGRVAIVTGSSRGIGRAIVERLAEHGAKVVISSRKADACEEVADAINARVGREAASPIPANISSKDELRRLVDETASAFGQIDILVCNAASNPYYGPMAGISDEQFRKILDNNIIANHWLIGMVAPGMMARKDGAIIIVSSIGGLKGARVIGAYNISKAADFQLARNLALEFGPAQHPRQLHRAGPGQDRFRPRAVGEPGDARRRSKRDAARAHRRARRDRRRGGVPRLPRRRLHDRPDHRHRRRRDDRGLRGTERIAKMDRTARQSSKPSSAFPPSKRFRARSTSGR